MSCKYSGYCNDEDLCETHAWLKEQAEIVSVAQGDKRWEMLLKYLSVIAKHVPPSAEQIAYQVHPRIQNERLR